jgi:hypothetical protein
MRYSRNLDTGAADAETTICDDNLRYAISSSSQLRIAGERVQTRLDARHPTVKVPRRKRREAAHLRSEVGGWQGTSQEH